MESAVAWWIFLLDVSLTAKKTEDCFVLVWSGWQQGLDADNDEKSRVVRGWRKYAKGKKYSTFNLVFICMFFFFTYLFFYIVCLPDSFCRSGKQILVLLLASTGLFVECNAASPSSS